jgi:hypothetical protein
VLALVEVVDDALKKVGVSIVEKVVGVRLEKFRDGTIAAAAVAQMEAVATAAAVAARAVCVANASVGALAGMAIDSGTAVGKGGVGMGKSSVASMGMDNGRGMLGKGNGARNGSGVGGGVLLCTGVRKGVRKGDGAGIYRGNGRGMRVGMGMSMGRGMGSGKGAGTGVGVCIGKGMGGVAVKTEFSVGGSASCSDIVVVDISDDAIDVASVPGCRKQVQQQRGSFVSTYEPVGRVARALGAVAGLDGGAQCIVDEQLSLVDEMDSADQQRQVEQQCRVSEEEMEIAAGMDLKALTEGRALAGASVQRASVAGGSSGGCSSSSSSDDSSGTDSGAVLPIGGLVGSLCSPLKRVRNGVDRFEAGPATGSLAGKRGSAASPSRGGGSASSPAVSPGNVATGGAGVFSTKRKRSKSALPSQTSTLSAWIAGPPAGPK